MRNSRTHKKTRARGSWPLLLVVGVSVVFAAAIMAQTRPKPGSTSPGAKKAAPASGLRSVVEIKAAERKPLSYYTSGVRGDLFAMPGVKEPVLPKPEPPKVEVAPPPAPEVIDPFADYAYTGSVAIGGEYVALIENAKTKEGVYVRKGDQFMGGTVSEVTDRGVSITVAGSAKTLYKTDEFKLTPLDKDADFRQQGQPRPGQPGPGGMRGMPGMAGPFGGTPGGMGFPGMQNLPPDVQQRIQQRFQGMTPEQMQQMRNRFMNRSFEGGQRRRRFF